MNAALLGDLGGRRRVGVLGQDIGALVDRALTTQGEDQVRPGDVRLTE
jgi:hypothetical protein